MAEIVSTVVIMANEAFMVQLQSPRHISLSGTLKFIVLSRIVSYCVVLYQWKFPAQQAIFWNRDAFENVSVYQAWLC